MENTMLTATGKLHPAAHFVTSDVIRLRDKIVNSYIIRDSGSDTWVIVDAGMSPGHAKKIFSVAESIFGTNARPAAIVLTHGHFDHVGALEKLLERWNVPVFAHELELPFLDGRSDYPPPDPTVGGGLMARMSPLFSRQGRDMEDRVQVLPRGGVVPHLSGWQWLHTPGHTAGHISLFKDEDRTLIAGDAFVTVKNESLLAVLLRKKMVSRPPAYFTTNWEQARNSIDELASLRPQIAATGHGIPMYGDALRRELDLLVQEFDDVMPRDGRYVRHPAISDADGVQFVPPAVPDPVPKVIAALALGFVAGLMINSIRRRRI